MEEEYDTTLIDAVRAQFPDLAVSEPRVIMQLLGTKSIAPWYKEWKGKQSLEKALPDPWLAAGLDGRAWDWCVNNKQTRAAVRKAHADKTKKLAAEHKQRVEAADRERDMALLATDSPLMDLMEAGFDQIPLAAQARVSSATDDAARKTLLDAALLQYRRARIADLYPAGIDKFVPGVGNAGPGA
jgi:hypothetical protein